MSFRLGLLLGSILPDLDFIPLIAVRFFDRALAVSFHRHFTHSLLGIGVFALLLYGAAALARRPRPSSLALGLSVGMLVHAALDLFMWFAAVHMTWPWGEPLNFYAALTPPDWAWNLTLAGEPAAYALLLAYLRRVWRVELPGWSQLVLWILVGSSLVLLGLVPFVPKHTFEVMAYGVSLPLGLLPAVAIVVNLHRTNRLVLPAPGLS